MKDVPEDYEIYCGLITSKKKLLSEKPDLVSCGTTVHFEEVNSIAQILIRKAPCLYSDLLQKKKNIPWDKALFWMEHQFSN